MKKSTTADRLHYLMTSRNLKQIDILRAAEPYAAQFNIKMNRSDISQYVSGKVEPGQDKLTVLGLALGVDPVWLMGIDVPMIPQQGKESLPHPEAIPISRRSVPLLGSIACGEPIFADEDYSVSVALGHDVDCDFALRCKGDSMIEARIYDGDIVFIKKQDFVDDGTIAAVLIDDDATLKRVYKLSDGRIELRAANERYRPIFVGGPDDTRTFRVLGKAVAFQSTIL